MKIKKSDGRLEDYNPEKFHEHVFDAVKNLNVSASEIEMNAASKIINGSTSKEIQKALYDSCADMISEDLPDANIASARLLNQDIRKEVYGKWEPRDLLWTIDKNIKLKIYDGEYLFKYYTRDEIKEFSKIINYDKDDNFVYCGLDKMKRSYLSKRYGKLEETPQEMFLMMNLFIFAKYSKEDRKKWIKEGYNILSNFEASLPTPVMIQLRTLFRRYISCAILQGGDSKETLANSQRAIYMLVASGCGLGYGPGDIRGLGADIDNGRLKHTGLQQLLKAAEKTTKGFVQPDRTGCHFLDTEVEILESFTVDGIEYEPTIENLQKFNILD